MSTKTNMRSRGLFQFRRRMSLATVLIGAVMIFAYAPFGFTSASPEPNHLKAITLDNDEVAELKAGDVVSKVWRDTSHNDGAVDVLAAVDIDANLRQVWTVMSSCDKALEVVREMKSCRVLEASDDGLWDVREQSFRAPFPLNDFRTIFRTNFTPYETIEITGMGGDMKVQEALWQLSSLETGGVRVAYHARIQPKFPLPRFLLRRAVQKDTPIMMRSLKQVAETLKTEAGGRGSEENELQSRLSPKSD